MSKKEGAALYAVYDLQVAAPDFDSHNFLVLAEWTRRQRKLGQIKIIVVPEENRRWDGARQFGNKKLDWRFDNLLFPSSHSWALSKRGSDILAQKKSPEKQNCRSDIDYIKYE